MAHISSTQIVDAVRGVLSDAEHCAVERHVTECEGCADHFRAWIVLGAFLERDEANEPPAGSVRVAKTYLASHTPGQPEPAPAGFKTLAAIVPALLFDTFEEALPAGVRSGAATTRHVLYAAPPLSIDLRFEATGPLERILLVGQIADSSHPAPATADARLMLREAGRDLAAIDANQFGEFQCEFDRRENLSLSIVLPDRGRIIVPLDRLPAPRATNLRFDV
jgi:anti-sigma factor RsiW